MKKKFVTAFSYLYGVHPKVAEEAFYEHTKDFIEDTISYYNKVSNFNFKED